MLLALDAWSRMESLLSAAAELAQLPSGHVARTVRMREARFGGPGRSILGFWDLEFGWFIGFYHGFSTYHDRICLDTSDFS